MGPATDRVLLSSEFQRSAGPENSGASGAESIVYGGTDTLMIRAPPAPEALGPRGPSDTTPSVRQTEEIQDVL